jgi:hypothetical protein
MSTRYTVEWLESFWIIRTYHAKSDEEYTNSFVCFGPADLRNGLMTLSPAVRKACEVARKTHTKQTVGESTET